MRVGLQRQIHIHHLYERLPQLHGLVGEPRQRGGVGHRGRRRLWWARKHGEAQCEQIYHRPWRVGKARRRAERGAGGSGGSGEEMNGTGC
jgi:hypothetical protein